MQNVFVVFDFGVKHDPGCSWWDFPMRWILNVCKLEHVAYSIAGTRLPRGPCVSDLQAAITTLLSLRNTSFP